MMGAWATRRFLPLPFPPPPRQGNDTLGPRPRNIEQVVEHLHANREAIATATNFLDRHFGAVLYPATAAARIVGTGAGYPASWADGGKQQGQGVDDPLRPPPLLLDGDQEAFERAAM